VLASVPATDERQPMPEVIELGPPRADSDRRRSGQLLARGHRAALLLHGERELQWLLLPALDDLLPELALVLHALELGLDVLLGDLEQPRTLWSAFFAIMSKMFRNLCEQR